MKFGELFGGEKKEEKRESRGNDGGDFMAIPNQGEELGPKEYDKVDPEKEMDWIRGEIAKLDVKQNRNQIDSERLQFLKNKLQTLEEQNR